MKKLFALLLALLLVSSVVLTACTTDNTESSTKGDETTTKGENESENESDTGSDLPIPNGDIFHFTLNITGNEGETFAAEAEWNNLEKTLILIGNASEDETLTVVYRNETVYIKTPGEEDYTVVTKDDIRNALENQLAEMDPAVAQLVEAILSGNFGEIGTPGGAFDPEKLLAEIPEEYRGVAEKILDLLPEEISLPEVELPELPELPQLPEDPEEQIAALLSMFEKTENEDGSVTYTLDIGKSAEGIKQLLTAVSAYLDMTPAAIMDSLGGEGTYENAFNMAKGSISGDDTFGDVLDFSISVLNAQGFRITDEKLIALVVEICKLQGVEATEETVAATFAEIRAMTVDQIFLSLGVGMTYEQLWQEVDKRMTGLTVAELIDMIAESGTSLKIKTVLTQASAMLDSLSCKLVLLQDADGYWTGATFNFALEGVGSAVLSMTLSRESVMSYPADLPSDSENNSTENGDGV